MIPLVKQPLRESHRRRNGLVVAQKQVDGSSCSINGARTPFGVNKYVLNPESDDGYPTG